MGHLQLAALLGLAPCYTEAEIDDRAREVVSRFMRAYGPRARSSGTGMGYAKIRYEVRGQVAVVTYDRQAWRNAWDVPTYREVAHAVEQANSSKRLLMNRVTRVSAPRPSCV